MSTMEAPEKGAGVSDIVWVAIGLAVVVAGYLLLQSANGGNGAGVGTTIVPSDAVQQAVVGAQVAEQQSSNTLAATQSTNAAGVITALAQAQDALTLGLAQSQAQTQQTLIAGNSAVAIANQQGQTAVALGNLQAQSNEYVAETAANASTQIADYQASAATNEASYAATAASSVAASQGRAESNVAGAEASASKTASNDSIWSSLFGGVGSILGSLFNFGSSGSGSSVVSVSGSNSAPIDPSTLPSVGTPSTIGAIFGL